MVVIVDEFADLIMQDKEDLYFNKLCRLAQKSRAARICLVLAPASLQRQIYQWRHQSQFSISYCLRPELS